MPRITKIRIKNFKRFVNYTVVPNAHMNIFVGDNETGKSTILEAISLVINGSSKKQDSLNLQNIFNANSIKTFIDSDQKYEDLPILEIDLFFDGLVDPLFSGDNNIDKERNAYGIRLVSRPNIDYISEINDIIKPGNSIFPFEFYETKFTTFGDSSYFLNKGKPKCVLVDASKMSTNYSTDEYIRTIFHKYTESDIKLRTKLLSEFNKSHNSFAIDNLNLITAGKGERFVVKNSTMDEFENHLTILEEDVNIANRGTGQQIIIKTQMALRKVDENIDVVLIEEPENHLSAVNLKKLISSIESSQDEQLFIATHSGYICSRLSLNNTFVLGLLGEVPVSLKSLSDDTAKYFIKAPSVGLLDFSLSKKTILVEGPSEYMLFEKFYKKTVGVAPEDDGVQITAVRGLSFKRYMELGNLLKNKVAVVTDNDGSYENCIERYNDYITALIQVFVHDNDDESTFEKVLYSNNKILLDKLFKDKDNVINYMLANKTEVAYALLDAAHDLTVPKYIKDAIEWIRK